MFRVISTKRFTYRGKDEDWSNGYTFSGAAPVDPAAWDAFFAALWAVEQPLLASSTRRVRMQGYADPAGFQTRALAYDPTQAANQGAQPNPNAYTTLPGDVAYAVRFRAGQTARGRPAYVIKYYHGFYHSPSDAVQVALVSLVANNLPKLRDGTLPGGAKLCRPNGVECGAPELLPFLTTRTLKRRGKRPQTP